MQEQEEMMQTQSERVNAEREEMRVEWVKKQRVRRRKPTVPPPQTPAISEDQSLQRGDEVTDAQVQMKELDSPHIKKSIYSASKMVPISELSPDLDQCPKMILKKAQFASQVPKMLDWL